MRLKSQEPNTQALMSAGDWQTLSHHALDLAVKKGATQAEITAALSKGFAVNVRLGEIDTVEYNSDKALEITVYKGQKTGSASTRDFSLQAIENAVVSACGIAQATGEDSCHGLADKALMANHYPALDLYYPWKISIEQAIEQAKQCEASGRNSNSLITNSEGAEISSHEALHLYANTHGFQGYFPYTKHSQSCVLLAGTAENDRQRDYEYSTAADAKDLLSPEIIGIKAAEKAVARLNARKIGTRKAPVIFEASIAGGILKHLCAAINGSNIYRQSSFLVDHIDQKIFPEFVTIFENPHILKALGSAPFDREGVLTSPQTFVENGILQSYILNSYTARKLGTTTTGNAGGVHNFQITSTAGDLNDLINQMGTGVLVTDVMGQGVNIITGDYSRGMTGFWIEKGEIKYPVHEITIAGNLKEMFLNIVAIGNDIDKRGNIWSGSLLIENMTIAGD